MRKSERRAYVERAYRAHAPALLTFCLRGWRSASGALIRLSEDEAEEAISRAVLRFLHALERENTTVTELAETAPAESVNAYRMLRHMSRLAALDLIRERHRERAASDLGAAFEAEEAMSRFERLLEDRGDVFAVAAPADLFETREARARVILHAMRSGRLGKEKLAILVMYLQGKSDHEIAQSVGLAPVQVQRHKHKIKLKLAEASAALTEEDAHAGQS